MEFETQGLTQLIPEYAISKVHTYVTESGDIEFLDKELFFDDINNGTVYEYLKMQIQEAVDRHGPYEIEGEIKFYEALDRMMGFAREKKDISLICSLGEIKARIYSVINGFCI